MARPTQVNTSLEAIRGLAALLVVAFHARLAIYAPSDFPADAFGNEITSEAFLLAPANFGRAAVALFFLLSGYLVGGQVLRQCAAGVFNARIYLINRFSRLWFVMAASIAFTILLDFLSRILFRDVTTSQYVAGPSQGRGTSSVSGLVCNLVFLQDGRCPAYGSNAPLWSISYEWFYYLMFPAGVVGVMALFKRRVLPVLIGVGVIAASLFAFGVHLLWLMPAWLIGAGVAELQRRFSTRIRPIVERRGVLALCVALTALGFLVGKVAAQGVNSVLFLIVGVFGAPLILVLAVVDPVSANFVGRLVTQLARVGTWSYTLYSFHMPIAFFVGVAWAHFALPVNPFVVYGLFLVLLPATYSFYPLVEARTPHVRTWLTRLTAPSR